MAEALKTCKTCGRAFKTPEDFLRKTSRWRVCEDGNLWLNCECKSTLVIPKGKYDWYSPDQNMSTEAASIYNILSDKEKIPKIPSAVMEVQQMIADENASSKKIADQIKLDPILAAEVLVEANNLKESSGQKITTLEHAVSYLGRVSLSELVVMGAMKQFKFPTKSFNEEAFWNQAVLTGRIAEALAEKYTPDISQDEVYIAGSLANVGKIISAVSFAEATDKIYTQQSDPRRAMNWKNLEGKFDVSSHELLGEIASSLWGLPDFVRDVCTLHHNVEEALSKGTTVERLSILDIVAVAIQIGHWVRREIYQIHHAILGKFPAIVGLSDADFDTLARGFVAMRNQVDGVEVDPEAEVKPLPRWGSIKKF